MALKLDSRPTYTICQGCPASGKSTWAKQEQDRTKVYGAVTVGIVNRDSVRRHLFNFGQWSEYKFTKSKEDRVTKALDETLKSLAAAKMSVIDDNTNLNTKYLAKTKEKAESLGYRVVFKQFFDVPLHKLIERNISREFSVPENVIHEMFRKQLEIQGRIIERTEGLPDCVIVDVDGTIAYMGKGESWGRGPFEWDKVLNDKPKFNVISMVQDLWVFNKVIFLTGRDGVALEDTKKWINTHFFNPMGITDGFTSGEGEIFIRAVGDMRPDCEIKEELLREKILPRYNVRLCIDDRQQMVDHYRALGLECWQVADGRF